MDFDLEQKNRFDPKSILSTLQSRSQHSHVKKTFNRNTKDKH